MVGTLLLLAASLAANTAAHISLKLSAAGRGPRAFIAWQVAGNVASFLGVLAYTALLRTVSLHVAYPLSEGLTAVGVLFAGGLLVLKEKISARAWVGTGLVLCGIVLFSV
jgi:multidrug transporter EmrE-like cation transporter